MSWSLQEEKEITFTQASADASGTRNMSGLLGTRIPKVVGGLVSPGGETIKPEIHIRLKCNRELHTFTKALGMRL